MIENNILYLDGKSLTIQEVYTASTVPLKVKLTDDSRFAIKSCREKLIRQIRNNPEQKFPPAPVINTEPVSLSSDAVIIAEVSSAIISSSTEFLFSGRFNVILRVRPCCSTSILL